MIGGYQFIFNGRQSREFGVSLVMIDTSYTNRPSGGDKSLVTASIRRNPEKQYLDTEYDDVLQFDIEIVFDEKVDIFMLTDLKNWLSSPVSYEELQICAEDFDRYYYNCIIHPKEDLVYGDGYRGISATVECDSPYAYEFETVLKYNLTPGTTNNFIFDNYSDDFEPMKPKLQFHMANSGNFSIQVKHYSDNKYMVGNLEWSKPFPNFPVELPNYKILLNNASYNECTVYCRMNGISISNITKAMDCNITMVFDHLNKGDIVYVDNKNCIITLNNDSTLNIFSKFNQKFFQLPRGMNKISVYGQADYVYMAYKNAKRLGVSYY